MLKLQLKKGKVREKHNKKSASEGEPSQPESDQNMMTFGGHLEVLRRMLFRIIVVVMVLAVVIFCFKDWTFKTLMAPSQWDFITYRCIEKFLH